ncbi:MAG: hypothetical protein ACRDXX_19580, partial [Stackebrandtia sp.]
MNDEVSEVYHSTVSLEGATGEVDGIEYVSSSDVEEAARAVVTAAAEARSREFQADPSSGFPTEDAYNEAAGDYN